MVGKDAQSADADDLRPLVAQPIGNQSLWIFGAAAIVLAGALFFALESSRARRMAPSIAVPRDMASGQIMPPPPLAVPEPLQPLPPLPAVTADPGPPVYSGPHVVRPVPPRLVPSYQWDVPTGSPLSPPAADRRYPASERAVEASGPPVVYEAAPAKPAATPGAQSKDERVHASRFENPGSTIPKGTVIQAVLETALDSTRPGFARAIVSRDVFSFDGSQILIAKGSRLIGEYQADLALGQKRALIQWQRLMRPDGVMMDIDSPAADPLGRAGVKGKVSSHFFERFGGAILQSSLDIGVQLATNQIANGSVIYALPGSLRGAAPAPTENIRPTLQVRQGASVSVFVAKDLDFSTVE